MLEINISLNDSNCLYEQIYEHIRNEIRKGKLLCGERLPSTRSLSSFLNVSRTTIVSAYDQLFSEGYIESRPHRGFFVCDLCGMPAPEDTGQSLRQNSNVPSDTGQSRRQNTNVLTAGQVSSDTGFSKAQIDFSPRAIDLNEFPYATWKKITRHVLADAKKEMFIAGEPQGDEILRNTIARYLTLSRGVNCSPQQVVIGAGNDYLLMLLKQILGVRNVAMEEITYTRAAEIFMKLGNRLTPVAMDDNGILVGELEQTDSDLAYVMPAHQYPTGIVMPITRRMELLNWASGQEDRYIIEDDYDSEFRYRGKPIPSLQASDQSGSVIYIGTFSKSIAPSIRVSYMVLPERLLCRYKSECGCFSSTVSRMNQAILNEFIRDGYFERHLNKMRNRYRMKHEMMLEGLSEFRNRLRISGTDAGLHLLLSYSGEISENELTTAAAEAGIRVYGLSDYYLDRIAAEKMPAVDRLPEKFRKATVIMGYAALSADEIGEGLSRLSDIVI